MILIARKRPGKRIILVRKNNLMKILYIMAMVIRVSRRDLRVD